jgi:hypothetical protein
MSTIMDYTRLVLTFSNKKVVKTIAFVDLDVGFIVFGGDIVNPTTN